MDGGRWATTIIAAPAVLAGPAGGSGSDPYFRDGLDPVAAGSPAQEDALAEQFEAGAAVGLALEHLKSYVESAGVMMFPRCNHGLGRRLERHGGAEGEVAGVRPARAGGGVAG